MKLVLENIGSGFQSFGVGVMSTGPVLGMTRGSKIQITAQQFRDYYSDICYFHTKKAGEVKARLRVDDEVASPEDVMKLLDAELEVDEPPPAQDTGPGLIDPTLEPLQHGAPAPAPDGATVNHNGPVDLNQL